MARACFRGGCNRMSHQDGASFLQEKSDPFSFSFVLFLSSLARKKPMRHE